MVRDDPEHFGGFATMPLPDVDALLRELEYAYDTLGLDGVVLFTSQGDRYLGDPLYEPFFEELERRQAIVFIHPTTIPPGANVPKLDIPYGVVEFTFDTHAASPTCSTAGRWSGTRRSATSCPTPAAPCPTSRGALPARLTCLIYATVRRGTR